MIRSITFVVFCTFFSLARTDVAGKPMECICELKGTGGILLHNFNNISSYGVFEEATSCGKLRHRCRDECDEIIADLLQGSNNLPFMSFNTPKNEAFGLTLCENYHRHVPSSAHVSSQTMSNLSMHSFSTLKNCEQPGQERRLRHKVGKVKFPYALCCGRQLALKDGVVKKVHVWYPKCENGLYVQKPSSTSHITQTGGATDE